MHPDGRLYVSAYQGTGADVLAAVAVAGAPVVDSVTLSPDPPRVHDTLHAFAQGHDSQGFTMNQSDFRFEWSRNGSPLFSSGPDLSLDSAAARRGDTISVRVTLTDGSQVSAPKSASVVVADSAPVVTSVVLSDASPTTNEVLTATAAATDADNDPLTFAFTWKVNGVVSRTVSGPSRSDTFDLGLAGNGDRGDTLTVDVSALDGTLQSFGGARATAAVVNSPPLAGVSLTPAAPTTNTVVSAAATASDADGDQLRYSFTWRVNGGVRKTSSGPNSTDSLDLGLAGNGSRGDAIVVELVVSDGTADSDEAVATTTVADSAPPVPVSLDTTTAP